MVGLKTRRLLRVAGLTFIVVVLWCGLARQQATAAAPGCSVALDGAVVQFDLSGFEPDFDPIDRIVITAHLRGLCTENGAIPDSTLVLSTYLENFQPDTTPILPDLLRPDTLAQNLGGFLTGKAVLVNGAGKNVAQGTLVAETFLNNAVHLVVMFDGPSVDPTAPTLRMQGAMTLRKDLDLRGGVTFNRPLTPAESALLRVHATPTLSWQHIIAGLAVHPPKMLGTAGSGQPAVERSTATVQTAAQPAVPRTAIGAAFIAAGVALAAWRLAVWLQLIRRTRESGDELR